MKYLFPKIRIIGVEPEDADAMYRSLQARQARDAGSRRHLRRRRRGAAGRRGAVPSARQYVDEVILVSTDEICAAIQDIFEDNRTIVEPAGALSVAGIKRYVAREQCRERTFVAINCGANMNFDRLRHVAERADIGGQREALIAVEIPEQKGSFLRFCEAARPPQRHRVQLPLQRRRRPRSCSSAWRSPKGARKRKPSSSRCRTPAIPCVDMSDNEMAKLHVRYMVGGHGRGIEHERLFRFEFPERPGALLKFLHAIGTQWNITLFHYRNHGSDYGRVLAGVQIPPTESVDFDLHVRELKYVYAEETDNPAYRMFLGG